MKLIAAPLIAVVALCFAVPAAGQDRVAGTWRVESVSGAQPPEGVKLTLTFANAGRMTATYTLSGRAQSWDYTYRVEDGQLILEPARAFGESVPVIYDLRFTPGKLELVTPEPESEANAETESDASADEAAEQPDAAGNADPAEPGNADEASADSQAADAADAADDNAEDPAEDQTDDTNTGEADEDTREAVWVLVPDNDS